MKKFNNITKKIVNDLNVATQIVERLVDKKIVSIFGSARTPETHKFYTDTMLIAKRLAEKDFLICTGGGPGLMEAGSRGAKDGGGQTLGLSIELPHEQKPNDYLDENINFQNFAQRKIVFSTVSNAYVVVPGGYGSLDELFEVLTLIQCKVMPAVPIVLYDAKYWEPLMSFIKGSLLKEGMIKSEDVDMIYLASTVDEAVEFIVNNIEV